MSLLRLVSSVDDLRVGAPLPSEEFDRVRRAAVLRHCKWDPQVGDQGTLAPFPLIVSRALRDRLFAWAERLADEARAAETEIARRPELWTELGVPRAISRVLRDGIPTPDCGRVMRFDFHPTTEGWRVSEVNADVPGGFAESTEIAALLARTAPGFEPCGAPGTRWAETIAERARRASGLEAPRGALLVAPGFVEDLQVVSYLGRRLAEFGCSTILARPEQLQWDDRGRARLASNPNDGPLAFLVRFFQAEWLPRLPRTTAWQPLFSDGRTPVANPGIAVLLESKRLPLILGRLRVSMPTWRTLWPETREPPRALARLERRFLLKATYSNNGDDVLDPEHMPPEVLARATRWLACTRTAWLAQRRFAPISLETPEGPMHACLGVFVVDGHPVGIYGRLSKGPIVDYRAMDTAVLVPTDERARVETEPTFAPRLRASSAPKVSAGASAPERALRSLAVLRS